MRRRVTFPVLAVLAVLPLASTGCSEARTAPPAGTVQTSKAVEAAGFCEVLLSDTQTAATVFAAPIWVSSGSSQVDQENIAARIALLDKVGTAPDGLADDLEVWRGYLHAVAAAESPAEVIAAGTDETDSAGDALSKVYTRTCL